MEKAVVFWSGGKDSALALYKAKQNPNLDIVGLVTVLNKEAGKSAVHNLPEIVIERQAGQTGLRLRKIWLNATPSNHEYEEALLEIYEQLLNEGVSTVIYGDIFLEDIKTYRENLALKVGIKILFPLWKLNPAKLMEEFIDTGFKAITCFVNTAVLKDAFLGRILNNEFIENLPSGIDPAGENGEYHTFCFDGPVFKNPVAFKTGLTYSIETKLESLKQTSSYIEVF